MEHQDGCQMELYLLALMQSSVSAHSLRRLTFLFHMTSLPLWWQRIQDEKYLYVNTNFVCVWVPEAFLGFSQLHILDSSVGHANALDFNGRKMTQKDHFSCLPGLLHELVWCVSEKGIIRKLEVMLSLLKTIFPGGFPQFYLWSWQFPCEL